MSISPQWISNKTNLKINLNLSTHAKQQLNKRFPNWTETLLKEALDSNPSFRLDNQIHTYIGTGWDMYDGTEEQKIRKKYKRRHLFLVSKPEGRGNKEGFYQPTIVFHTHASITRRVTNQNCELINQVSEEDFKEAIKGATLAPAEHGALWYTTDASLALINYKAWQYGKIFKLIVKNVM